MDRNTKKLLFAEFVSQTVAIYTVYNIMFSERSGLTSQSIGTLLAIFSVTTLLAEIPTGYLADIFPRKYSLVLSKLMLALGMFSWLRWPTFPSYAFGMVCMGLSESISSGAMQAYIYDTIDNAKEQYSKINRYLWASMMSGFLISAFMAWLIGPNYSPLLVLSIISPLLGSVLYATLRTDRRHSAEKVRFKDAFKNLFAHQKILTSVLAIVALKALVDVLIEYMQVYYHASGVATKTVPILILIGNIVAIILFLGGSHIVPKLKKAELRWFLFCSLFFVGGRFFGNITSIVGIFIAVRLYRLLYVYEESDLQHHFQSHIRATMTSIVSMTTRLVMAGAFWIIGTTSHTFARDNIQTPLVVYVSAMTAIFLLAKIYSRSNPVKN